VAANLYSGIKVNCADFTQSMQSQGS